MNDKHSEIQAMVNCIVKKERKKYNKELLTQLLTALADGQGRVNACKIAGIHYETFTEWMSKYPEFSEAVKKTEAIGNDRIADICKRRIIEDTSWQSAAWWLERNFPEQFGQRAKLEHSVLTPKIVVENEDHAQKLKKIENK